MFPKFSKFICAFRKAVVGVCLLLPSLFYAQTPHQDTLRLLEYTDSVEKYGLIDELKAAYFNQKRLEIIKANHWWVAHIRALNDQFNIYIQFSKIDSSYITLQESKSILDKHKKEIGDSTYQIYTLRHLKNVGIYAYAIKDLITACNNFENFDNSFSETPYLKRQDYDDLIQNANYWSATLFQRGKYEAFVPMVLKNMAYREKISNPENPSLYFRQYNSLALAKWLLKDTTDAVLYMQKALEQIQLGLERNPKPSGIDINAKYIFLQAAEMYLNLKGLQNADIFLKKARETVVPTAQFDNLLLRLEAKAEILRGDFASANQKYSQALWVGGKPVTEAQFFSTAQTHYEMAQLSHLMANERQALADCQNALIALSRKFNNDNPESNPALFDTRSRKDLLNFVAFKAQTLLNLSARNPDFLQTAYTTSAYGKDLIDSIRTDFTSDFDKQYLVDVGFSLYETHIAAAHALYQKYQTPQYVAEAFRSSEQSKGLVLLEAMKSGQAEGILSEEQRNRLYQLKTELTRYSKAVQDDKNPSPQNPKWVDNQNKFLTAQNDYATFMSLLEEQHPEYYQLRYHPTLLSLAETQNKLLTDKNETLLAYFVGDSSLFLFVINKNKFDFIQVKKDFPLETWVGKFRETMQKETYRNSSEAYCDMAFRLYEKLIQPVQAQLTQNVILIPDGCLAYLPFEALLSKKPTDVTHFSSHDYLVRHYSFNYCFSANLLHEMIEKKHLSPPTEPLIGFAPFCEKDTTAYKFAYTDNNIFLRDSLGFLPSSRAEVDSALHFMGGKGFYQKDANKQFFIEIASKARIIHLSTHASASYKTGEQSYLVFSKNADGILPIKDVYNLRLNSDLVTLSACETGLGQMRRGEGIISIARAFAYAGSKAILTTLWKVEDNRTKDVMSNYYSGLSKGLTKSNALQQGQLQYIKSQNKNVSAHPFFWSGFIGIGDNAALN